MYRLLMISLVFLLAFAPNDARKANDAYERGDYARAAELYRQAIQSDPDDPKLYFNLGNSLAKSGQAEEAVQAYENFKSMTNDPREKSMADYNIGNLLSEAQQLETAADFYREALRNNPDDPDAKHNYELALRQQQEQQQEQQQNQDQDQNQDEDQDQNQDQEQDQQDQEQDQNQGQNQDQNQQQDPGDSGEEEQESQISLEEAESILDALEQKERELLRDREKDTQEGSSSNDRDW